MLTDGPGRDDLVHDVALVVSELMTNSVRARSRLVRLSLALHRDVVRIVVDDDAPGEPKVRNAEDAEPSGRGMAIVASLATAWSVERLIPGKQVWAELAVPVELTADLPSCHRPVRFHLDTPADPPHLVAEPPTPERKTVGRTTAGRDPVGPGRPALSP